MNRRGALAVVSLLTWQLGTSVASHPDYLAYFNEIAAIREEPSDFLLDSNLDWGQDLDRLSRRLQGVEATSLSLSYFGSADGSKHGLPEWRTLEPHTRATGWIAISEMIWRGVGWPAEKRDGYLWLDEYEYERIGSSIRIYYVPE